MDTTAIIQFIGIVLFSSAVPGDPGVHAILPRIDRGHEHRLTFGTNVSQTSSSTTEKSSGVEDHVAAILFRKEDVLARSGDFASEGTLRSRWGYVELEGEQVQFLTNTANDVPVIPRELPRAATLEGCSSSTTATAGLKDEFHGPAYAGAQAVVDIPFGKLGVCAKRTSEVDGAQLRVDTTLLMKTDGVLIIAAKKASEAAAKTITLKGNAILYVVNVPPHYVFTGTYSTKAVSEPHWLAYTAMIDSPCPTQPETSSVTATCDFSAINSAWRQVQSRPPTDVIMMVNSECSNTQWP